MKFLTKDKIYLRSIGVSDMDFNQMEKASTKTIYTMCEVGSDVEKKINRKEAISILGREKYLCGLHRSSFHRTATQINEDETLIVYFDSSRYF